MDERSDNQLLADVASDPTALETFYRRHVGRVLGFGARRLTRPEDVADFTADVFVQVLLSARSFDNSRGDAVPWLYGVAGNVARA